MIRIKNRTIRTARNTWTVTARFHGGYVAVERIEGDVTDPVGLRVALMQEFGKRAKYAVTA